MFRFWAVFFCLPVWAIAGGVNSGTILLYNDSPYILTATIQAYDGTFLGEFTIQPKQQKNFTQNLFPTDYERPGNPDVSLTPYTVIWQCPSEGLYSMCTNISPGEMVRATACPGILLCNPKQEPKKPAPASTLKKKKSSQN